MSSRRPPPNCAICGADIPARARACPDCGADERNGWSEQDTSDGLDLPDTTDEEISSHPARPRSGPSPFWLFVGVVLLLTFVLMALHV